MLACKLEDISLINFFSNHNINTHVGDWIRVFLLEKVYVVNYVFLLQTSNLRSLSGRELDSEHSRLVNLSTTS